MTVKRTKLSRGKTHRNVNDAYERMLAFIRAHPEVKSYKPESVEEEYDPMPETYSCDFPQDGE